MYLAVSYVPMTRILKKIQGLLYAFILDFLSLLYYTPHLSRDSASPVCGIVSSSNNNICEYSKTFQKAIKHSLFSTSTTVTLLIHLFSIILSFWPRALKPHIGGFRTHPIGLSNWTIRSDHPIGPSDWIIQSDHSIGSFDPTISSDRPKGFFLLNQPLRQLGLKVAMSICCMLVFFWKPCCLVEIRLLVDEVSHVTRKMSHVRFHLSPAP